MYCSFSCQSLFSLLYFALLSNEIDVLLRQALFTTDRMKLFPWLDSSPLRYAQSISFFAHLYCNFQLGRQYQRQESAGERVRCSLSPDRKFLAEKKSKDSACQSSFAFTHVRGFTYVSMTAFFPRACWNYRSQNWDLQRARNVYLILCSNTFTEKSFLLPRIFLSANATQPLLHL